MVAPQRSEPQAQLSVFDAVMIVVGLIVGIGIFRAPSIVAGNVASEAMFIAVWLIGGAATLIGALCYAELSAAHPNAGGEYHFLSKAYGKSVAMMFGWARCAVIQTGAIAAVAFMLGDYLAQIAPMGIYGPAIYAALSVVVLTAVNVVGTTESKNLQIVVTFLEIAAVLAIIWFGFFGTPDLTRLTPVVTPPQTAALGMAMIFVLLSYGGWNEAAYLTGELKDAPRNIAKVLTLGTLITVGLYVLTNWAMLSVLGLDGLRNSNAVAADMMRVVAGRPGEILVTLAIAVAAVSTLNATIFTGSRVFYAMARDLTVMRWVGTWNGRGKTPANAQLLQAAIALALIGMGAVTRDGFKAMIDYTAPVFWLFLLLVGLALFVLRRRYPQRPLPYRVPLYPFTPIVFCLTCAYMLYASLAYSGKAALVGLVVLAAGTPILLFKSKHGGETSYRTAPSNTALK
ncbi:amino acid permease [Pigmentiphaga aceris]|uniref:Amino acid permease n=1 Tax=Pigmentiphaga aceris TaxID=1940612 RepID=A0A5C0B1T7_9BURK|nr:amino acid permease [Pigmentiphaga aceris]QEI07844.1 amino acid permease [Pigmentiphaga aceris]